MAEPGTVEQPSPAGRRRPDPVGLGAGLVALVVAVLAVGGGGVLHGVDPRWVLAVAAVGVGLLLLLTSLRRPR